MKGRRLAAAQDDGFAVAQAELASAGGDVDRTAAVDRQHDIVIAVGEIAPPA